MKDYQERNIETAGTKRSTKEDSCLDKDLKNSEASTVLEPTILATLITQLPKNLSKAYVLHDIKGISYSTIANMLWIKEMEVRRLVHKARLHLRQLWQNHRLKTSMINH